MEEDWRKMEEDWRKIGEKERVAQKNLACMLRKNNTRHMLLPHNTPCVAAMQHTRTKNNPTTRRGIANNACVFLRASA